MDFGIAFLIPERTLYRLVAVVLMLNTPSVLSSYPTLSLHVKLFLRKLLPLCEEENGVYHGLPGKNGKCSIYKGLHYLFFLFKTITTTSWYVPFLSLVFNILFKIFINAPRLLFSLLLSSLLSNHKEDTKIYILSSFILLSFLLLSS
jgi:hypothetical protein